MNEERMIKYILGEGNSQENEAMKRWLSEDKANEVEFAQVEEAWRLSRGFVQTAEPDVDAAWNRFVSRRDAEDVKEGSKTRLFRKPFLRVAAAVLVVLSIAAIAYRILSRSGTELVEMELVATDSVLKDTLSDGTIVTLNKNSSIHVETSFLKGKRVVKMGAGEVFFDVARDESKPFEVHVGEIKVTVLGTSFNVKKKDDQVEVTVSTGQVAVYRKDQRADLVATERVTVNPQTNGFEKTRVKDQLYEYYVNNRLVIRDTPLMAVVSKLEEEHGVTITIQDPMLRDLPLTATLGNDPLDKILAVIAETLDFEVEKVGRNYILK